MEILLGLGEYRIVSVSIVGHLDHVGAGANESGMDIAGVTELDVHRSSGVAEGKTNATHDRRIQFRRFPPFRTNDLQEFARRQQSLFRGRIGAIAIPAFFEQGQTLTGLEIMAALVM